MKKIRKAESKVALNIQLYLLNDCLIDISLELGTKRCSVSSPGV